MTGLARQTGPLRRMGRAFFILVFAIVGGVVVRAQGPALPAAAVAAAAAETEPSSVRLLVGRSTVLDVGKEISRVSLTSAEVADALVTSPSQLLINGKTPGTISMFVWDRAGALKRYEVVVQRDLARLSEQMKQLFPGERIDVQSNGRNVVLSGVVSNKDLIEKAVDVAAGYVEKREEVVTLLQLEPNAPSNQVLLRVRFAEVSRNAMTELGASFAANGYKNGRWFGRSTTQQYAAPEWDEQGRFVFSDFLNLFLFDTKNELAGVIRALQNKGLFQSLAEPNLVAESGKEASFLAGGEFPIPVVQGGGSNLGISIVFKEFGIRLTFTPTVVGNRVHLKVKPEVSTLDFNNAIVLDGFRIPALSTRRTETELELENGQTFAIAGLVNNTMRSSISKIPGIGDIPILGLLFQSKAAQKEQTELVVMITPEILPNNSRGVTPDLPRLHEPFLEPLPPQRQLEPPPPAFESSSATAADPGSLAVNANAPVSSAAAMAALPAAPAPRPLTERERKDLERAERDERERAEERAEAEERAKADERKRQAAEAQAARRAAEEEQERQEKAAREQARRDAEAAKQAAEEAKRAAEAAERQAELDRKHQKAIEEAAAELRAAEEAYQAELAKQQSNP